MKKLRYILFALLLSFISITVYAKDNIEIKSITLDSKSETTTIKSEPTFSGLEMNYDIAFEEVGDFAKYKIVIENNTNKAYKVSEEESFKLSDYVTYNYESSQELKPRTTSTVYVVIRYSQEVNNLLLELKDGKYNETNKAILQVKDENNVVVENPKTGVANPILIIVFTMILSVCIVIMINKKKPAIKMIVFCICLIPIAVYAVETLKLTINVKIEINYVPKYKVIYFFNEEIIVKADEINGYRMLNSDCNVLYLNSISEDNKYYKCNTIIDDNAYKEGELVTLKGFKNINIDYNGIAQPQTDGSYLINGDVSYNDVRVYRYDIDDSDFQNPCESIYYEEYNFFDSSVSESLEIKPDELNVFLNKKLQNCQHQYNDKQIMNFSNTVEDHWDNGGYVYVEASTTFKMPSHDAVFWVPGAA